MIRISIIFLRFYTFGFAQVMLLSLIFFSCERLTEPLGRQEISLTIESAEVTEVWLRLKVEPADSRIGERLKPEITVQTTTMDTTSHNFTWQIDTFGCVEHLYHSILWDIFVVNENDVWAVGAIHTDDTDEWNEDSTEWILPYSALHWNGNQWEYIRIFDSIGQLLLPIDAIWYFTNDKIYIAIGAILKYNGNVATYSYKNNSDNGEMIRHLWAASENEIYGGGTKGLIVKFNGISWQRIPCRNDIDFWDIWGIHDEKTGKTRVWIVGNNLHFRGGVVYELNDNGLNILMDENTPLFGASDDHTVPTAVWAYNDKVYITYAGWTDTRLYRHDIKNFRNNYKHIQIFQPSIIRSINGNMNNDIIGVGYRDMVWHYNGKSSMEYFRWPFIDGRYYSVKQYENSVYACGNSFVTINCYIIRGTR